MHTPHVLYANFYFKICVIIVCLLIQSSIFWWLSCNQNTNAMNIIQFQLAHVVFYMYNTHILSDGLDNNACSWTHGKW
jgi:hypothetical protein